MGLGKMITFVAWIVHGVRLDNHFCCLESSWSYVK